MQFFTKFILIFCVIFETTQITQAQTVTNPWATLASGTQPNAIAFDGFGNSYTINNGNCTVSKISANGTVTPTWATLFPGTAPFYFDKVTPTGIVLDGSGNVYVTNLNNSTISKITSSGICTQSWATLTSGSGPTGITIDASGNLYTVNESNHTVSKITPDGTVTQVWATLASGAGPLGITIDGSGNLYTANTANNTVSKITSNGTCTQVWATLASGAGIYAIASDVSGNVFTANRYNNTVSQITTSGICTQAWATLASGTVLLSNSITIDGAGNVYIADYGNNNVIKITSSGTLTQAWVTLGSSVGPASISIDGSGTIYTANYGNNTVTKISSANTWTGANSTAWNTGSNWSFGTVPISTDYVIIPSTTNQPIINAAGAVAYKATIQSGGILNIQASGTLNATSSIVVNPSGYITGNYENITGTATLQQNVIGQRGYRVFANPFSTSQTNLSSTGLNATVTTANDVKTWDQTVAAWSSSGSGYGSVTIAGNQPYACFIRGASTDNISGSAYTTGPSAFTYSVSGTLNGASTGITPANTSNYLIVGNPYAAPVNTQALTGQTSTGYYTYQIGVSGNGQTKQGSWVVSGGNSNTSNTIPVLGVVAYQPASTSTFNITTSDINTGGTPQGSLFGIEKPFTQMELLLQHANGDYADKLFVRLDASATNNGTDKMELKKLYNDVTNVYTIADDKNTMAIDARSTLNTIPMGVSTTAGDYTFKLNSNSLPDGTTIYINDKYTNTKTELTASSPYNFSVTSDAASQGTGRFELVFSSKSITTLTDPNAGTLKAAVIGNIIHGNTVALQIEGAVAPVNVLVKDISGKAISTAKANNGIQYISIGNTVSGMILLQISDGKSTVIQKVMKL